jgi:hypothetical protein
MILGRLQSLLSDFYALELSYDVYDFVLTDQRVARELDANGRDVEEKLLIAEGADGAGVTLYLDDEMVDRLREHDPSRRLDGENLEDFWTVLEGISHFVYFAWNAARKKSVTLLEMELQAEVDKFIGTALMLQRQGEKPPAGLHYWLFDLPKFDDRLGGRELIRYRHANRYAGKYCQRLAPQLSAIPRGGELKSELRRFYRYTQHAKLRHINSN